MKITRRQLRKIIKEVRDLVPPDPSRPWGSYAENKQDSYYDVIVMSPNGDSLLVDGVETYLHDVPSQLEAVSGFPMEGNDPDNLIFALENMVEEGYVELEVTYENGQWGW